MVCTSPPFWGLRDYGTATWDGGDPECGHVQRTNKHGGTSNRPGLEAQEYGYRDTCGKCGATRIDSQLGLERTPEEYVANMVAVFREVRRVLRDDGTLWLNLGDSYAASNVSGSQGTTGDRASRTFTARTTPKMGEGLKPKDLVGIPWRVAFALQADGWYLRSDIIWSKPNPMPESVTDRPTKSHEYLFLLSKSPRYFFDADAVREDAKPESAVRYAAGYKHFGEGQFEGSPTDMRHAKTIPAEKLEHLTGRNIRSVWTIATQPYPGAHFAVFPPKLVEPCIKAGTSERGVCPDCGSPWLRMVERTASEAQRERYAGLGQTISKGVSRPGGFYPESPTVTGWEPTCTHAADPVPATVLDIFAGSGTTAMVAQALSRRAILIDLNPEYLEQQMKRNTAIPLGLEAA